MCYPTHVLPNACVARRMCYPTHVLPGVCVARRMCCPAYVLPGACVTRCMCYPAYMLPGVYVTRRMCHPAHVSPGACVTRRICCPAHMLPGACSGDPVGRLDNTPYESSETFEKDNMKISFIGCGNMGEAILAGIHKDHTCYACEPRADRQATLKKKYRVTFGMVADVVKVADVVILAVKPQDLADVLAEMRTLPIQKKLVISIAAGVTTGSLEKKLGGARVVRVMPNLPAMTGEGMSGLCRGKKATSKDVALAQGFFDAIGRTVIVSEKMMDAVTAVSGSGPAYVFLFVECWMNAARKLGFSEKEASALVYQTLAGSVHMLAKSADPAATLRQRVTSKGGTTQAATDVFLKKNISGMFDAALKAARDRARDLSK